MTDYLGHRLLSATHWALSQIKHPRFFSTERGYQGLFAHKLQTVLEQNELLIDPWILEQEYPKRLQHGTRQRPDIILHIPAEVTGDELDRNNLAVWALKLRADEARALDDFRKLDEMISILRYRYAFFINIDGDDTHAQYYSCRFKSKIFFAAVKLLDGRPKVFWSHKTQPE